MSNIIISGAKEGNLENISLEIPRDKLVVFTGLSGSGKSTLAVDVLFNECQRKYLEAIGLQGIRKPKIDFIHNVSPAILAAALDCDLTGIIYIMDEPTIGLHPKDTEGMITILKKLRDRSNTVIVIEHDPDVMDEADYIVDIGPGSGKHGGKVIGTGTLEDLKRQESSVTGQYLRKYKPNVPRFRKGTGDAIEARNDISLFYAGSMWAEIIRYPCPN